MGLAQRGVVRGSRCTTTNPDDLGPLKDSIGMMMISGIIIIIIDPEILPKKRRKTKKKQ